MTCFRQGSSSTSLALTDALRNILGQKTVLKEKLKLHHGLQRHVTNCFVTRHRASLNQVPSASTKTTVTKLGITSRGHDWQTDTVLTVVRHIRRQGRACVCMSDLTRAIGLSSSNLLAIGQKDIVVQEKKFLNRY